MNTKIKNLLQGNGENYILPFFWLHGEEEAVLREYMEAIHNCGIGAVCVESRPHPDYCGPIWWHDMDIIIEEAKKRNMKVWILDDSHFPTGYANGIMKDAPAELCRQYLYYSSVEVVGPMKDAQLKVSEHAIYKRSPFGGSMFSRGSEERRHFDDDTMLNVCAARIDRGFDAATLIDITEFVKDGELIWDVPAGRWCIYVNYLTRNAGSRDHYINMLNKRSARKQIEAVYEPHLKRYEKEFGKTIAGFFSDEPELGNGAMYSKNNAIGQEQDLPWSHEVEEQMKCRLGEDWRRMLPLLWEKGNNPQESAKVRYVYMDIITRLVEEDFSKQVGGWCEEHGVEYIGHLIEDNNSHARLGPSLGHFFRGLSGQHMAGIDDIGGQVMPAGEVRPSSGFLPGSKRDGEFYHYLLGKLGSSYGAIDPKKKGRTMCEIFGAYGWSEGVRQMKYLVDHFLVRGVNYYVPHAFSAKKYPDPDCPPHFYADGHDPQYRHFSTLMRYLNRMCALISDGASVTPAAILYHAEAEWAGNYMLDQKPARVLTEHQIDFNILPIDVFTEKEKYQTKIGKQLRVNTQTYKVLIVPYAEFVTVEFIDAVTELKSQGFPVIFVDALPSGVCNGEQQLISALSECRVVALSDLADYLIEQDLQDIKVVPASPMLRSLHYKEDNDIYLFTNEDMAETFCGTITLPSVGALYVYDVWNNQLKDVEYEQDEEKTTLNVTVSPYESLVIVFDQAEDELVKAHKNEEELILKAGWSMSLATAKEYPNFHDKQQIETFESVGLKIPSFSGIIRYETTAKLSGIQKASLLIEDAFEGVEVLINGNSVGIQVAPPFIFDISNYIKDGNNDIRIEVATTLERERNAAPPIPGDFLAALSKAPILAPSGIVGEVKLICERKA